MSDRNFEQALQRMYARTARLPDEEKFLAQLDRRRTMRRNARVLVLSGFSISGMAATSIWMIRTDAVAFFVELASSLLTLVAALPGWIGVGICALWLWRSALRYR